MKYTDLHSTRDFISLGADLFTYGIVGKATFEYYKKMAILDIFAK